MKFDKLIWTDKNGDEVELRSARVEDAEALIEYMKVTTAETPYLIREPEEVTLTVDDEKSFIQGRIDAPRDLMLVAFMNGKHVGNCSLMSLAGYKRYAHRCEIAIALYKEFCGRGIGRKMLEIVLDVAKSNGYEQAELEVIAGNTGAIALYEKLGFKKYGTFPDNMKYKDGSYEDAYWMMKKLH